MTRSRSENNWHESWVYHQTSCFFFEEIWIKFICILRCFVFVLKNHVTPSCFPTACKILGIAVGSQEMFRKKCTILFELFTSEDVMGSLRRPRRFYGAPAACNGVSTELYLAIDCAFAEYPPSAHDMLRIFTSRPQRALRADCVHKAVFTYW